MNRNELPDAFVVMYSVIDKTSFKTVEDELARLQNWDALRSRSLIVVGNKIDLVRSRAVSTQGEWTDANCLRVYPRGRPLSVPSIVCIDLLPCLANTPDRFLLFVIAVDQMANAWRAPTEPSSWRCPW